MTREQMFSRIRDRLGVSPNDQTRQQAVTARCEQHDINTIPARARQSHPELVNLFEYYSTREHATVSRVDNLREDPAEIMRQLDNNQKLCINAEVEALGLPFELVDGLTLAPWQLKTSLAVSVTTCFAGVAETGTIVIASSPGNAISQNFLGDKHIVLLPAEDIVGAYEEVWQKLREQDGLPRDITFVSSPSCTGDIEMVIEYGAHGPRELHVIIIGQSPPDYQPLS